MPQISVVVFPVPARASMITWGESSLTFGLRKLSAREDLLVPVPASVAVTVKLIGVEGFVVFELSSLAGFPILFDLGVADAKGTGCLAAS